jgi:hypothetical protein
MKEFGITPAQMGRIYSAFILGYAAFMIPGGDAADRLEPRTTLALMRMAARGTAVVAQVAAQPQSRPTDLRLFHAVLFRVHLLLLDLLLLGEVRRAGFVAATISRHDFDVNWNSVIDRGGIVVGKDIDITIDVEALRDSDFRRR